ncbi:penicillin acylase family protein [Streptomyces sp. NPDC000594]|uniref:penicillin acylase family protein n=1 Tax=Streptomyces sp. NPDC000594 TaxID=3154261 RepID=UPI003324EE2A
MNFKVYRDDWGIPHLRASGAEELAFAQGYNAAVDRAWQIEVDRHRSQGTSASFLGESAVDWDRFARQARLDDTARRCFERLDPATAAWVTRYAEGVDAGLAEGAARAPQFAATGLTPDPWRPWSPLGIWLTAHILFAGFPTKFWRDEVGRVLGDDLIGLFATDAGGSGSNGWLVTGERTASGAALIAGDPHRIIEDPGVYQQIRLACDEFDVVGLAMPGVPGIAHFGHAGPVAWAITNAMADYQDLYRERLRTTATGVEALGPDGWRPATAHTETIEVAGGDPVTVGIVETERGPVIMGGPGDPESYSLRTPPRVTGELGFDVLPALLRARTVADIDRAVDRWVEPVNVVQAADTSGGVLHRVAGRVPLRHPDNRMRPVDAWAPGHTWQGWHEPPRREVDGVAVMANERGLAAPLGAEFAPAHRAERIRALLGEHQDWSAPAMSPIHMDTRLDSAGPLLALVAGLDGLSGPAAALRDRLLAWDRRMDAESADAARYAQVRSAVARILGSDPVLAPLAERIAATGHPRELRPWLAFLPRVGFALEGLLTTGALPELDRAGAARTALEEVAAEATDEGTDGRPDADVSGGGGGPEAVWGDTHRLAPWQALPGKEAEAWPGLSGDQDCVLSTSSVPGVTDLSWRGPAARYVWDLADRDRSLWVVPFGASGAEGDPHRRDQLPLWLTGGLIPVLTDWNRLTEENRVR